MNITDSIYCSDEFKHISNSVPIGIHVLDSNGNCIYINDFLVSHLNIEKHDVDNNVWTNSIHKEDKESIEINWNEFSLNDSKDICKSEYRVLIENGSFSWSQVTCSKIRNGDKNVIGYVCIHSDVTEFKNLEKELYSEKNFFEQVFNQSSVSTQILDKDGNCVKINPKLSEIFGVKAEDIEGKYNIFSDGAIIKSGVDKKLKKTFVDGKPVEWEVNFDIGLASKSTGVPVSEHKKNWFGNWAYPIYNSDGVLSHVILQHTDIDKRKKLESNLIHLIKEKETVIRETHHRIKNSLQQIYSLLGLQSQPVYLQSRLSCKLASEDISEIPCYESIQKILSEARRRILTISLIHKMFYDKNSDVIYLLDFIKELSSNIEDLYSINKKVSIAIIGNDVPLSIDVIVPVGLAINEIVSNCYKHAFEGKDFGNINIELKSKGDNCIIVIADDGIGLNLNEILIRGVKSLGISLIYGLIQEQLNGKVNLKSSRLGTEYELILYNICKEK